MAANSTMSPSDATTEKRVPISPEDESNGITPAFQMKDVSTIESTRRRSPSPGVITSRRGRSRSPVASRPGSRAGRTSVDPPAVRDGSISEAAIAAGAAAIAAKRGPSPFDYRRSPSPPSAANRRYEETVNKWPSGSFECSPLAYNLSIGSFDWNQGMVDTPSRYDSRYHRDHAARSSSRYPSPPPEMRYDPYYDERHRRDYRYEHQPRHHDRYYERQHRNDRHADRYYHKERQPSMLSQPLYSEHHILSTATYEEDKKYERQSSSAFRDAPTPTCDNSRTRSVFRGVDESAGYKSKVVTALKNVEDSPVAKKKGGKKDGKKKRAASAATTKSAKKKKVTKKSKNDMPKELLLDDESPPVSPSKASPAEFRTAPSPTNIDKELSAIGIDALDVMNSGVGEDYLGNLSFRKSYDLEQMFSFMKSPKGSMKEATGGGNMMDLKFGSMSFTNSFLMSASGEEREGELPPKNDLKMRSHGRRPSYGLPRRSSRSPTLFTGGIPTIHTLTSQNSMGLTPINSFSGDNPIVPLTSHDGMALTAMFAASPTNVPVDGGDSAMPPNMMQGPPSYNDYPTYRHDQRGPPSRNGPPHSSQQANTPPHGPMPAPMSSGSNKRMKMMPMGHIPQTVIDVTKRADLYVLLKRLAPAFAGFQFKLSEVDLPLTSYGDEYHPTDQQLVIAKRRVNCSLCAFGGSVPRRAVSFEADSELTPIQKREKEEKQAYEKDLSSRYFMKEHCISWDVELHDVITPEKKKPVATKSKEMPKYCAPVTPSTPNHNNAVTGIREKGKKVKYRCKLCGQPKQNHTCPYQSTVMRSIGTMVYPAVNAFVSDEPGKLAPALSEMNNFTSLLSQDMSLNTRDYRPYNNGYNVLTPDSHWSPNTPGAMSAISTHSTPGNRKRDHLLMSRTMSGVSTAGGANDGDALFRGTIELKPEQYRRVHFKADPKQDAYQYPHIPTPYSQRKEMGDTLFALSREVPKLADSCAAILRSARENDCWDQAVAELTTQVLIILKCEEQDYALEGLKRHLLTLGIAC